MRDEAGRKRVITIGSSKRKLGKTSLICSSIAHLHRQFSICAVKIICSDRIPSENHYPQVIHRQESFRFIRAHPGIAGEKQRDTERYIEAGADQAFLMITRPDALAEAWEALSAEVTSELVFIESTAAGLLLHGELFIFIFEAHSDAKASAGEAGNLADIVLERGEPWYVTCTEGSFTLRAHSGG